jgi:multicomponent K+:H+ antiporter subunit G
MPCFLFSKGKIMSFLWEFIVSLCILIGCFFTMIGSFGLIKLPDLMTRLHAPTKATTLGVGSILIASMLHSFAINGRLSINELLVALFLFLTAPISAHFISRTHLHLTCGDPDQELPDTRCECGWSMFDE